MKAFRTTLWDIESIVAATTSGRAKAICVHAARDAGWDSAKFTVVKARRAPKYDAWAATQESPGIGRGVCYSETYVARILHMPEREAPDGR